MRKFEIRLISLVICVLALVVHQSIALADDEYEEDDIDVLQVSTLRSLKELTPEEEALANEARAHIAKAIENNIVRLLAIASARGDRRPRQEDEDEESVTPNPNVLPQVAQILGAIFTGGLNISRVVDQTFGLVPNVLRNQVGGIVKLLTGENMAGSSTPPTGAASAATKAPSAESVTSAATTAPTASPSVTMTNEAVIVELPKSTSAPPKASTPIEPEVETVQDSDSSLGKGKYRIRNRTKAPTTTTIRPLEDDEIEKLVSDVKRAARAYETSGQQKDPRGLADAFKTVISRIDFNMTEISRAVPSIFQGTRQAFTVLENLGLLDVNDVLDELDLPALEEEEEEEE